MNTRVRITSTLGPAYNELGYNEHSCKDYKYIGPCLQRARLQ